MQNDTIKTNKEFLLNESKVFCMFPWTHMNVSPKGDVYPCCSNSFTKPFGNVKNSSLKEQFNSGHMKQLRLNMLNETPSEICKTCYQHEDIGGHTFRDYSKKFFSQHFDETVPTTQEDGTVPDFKMRYFDIRFSNICNFKCRTCGAEFSSQWGAEMRANQDPKYPIVIHADDHNGGLLQEVLEHVEHIDMAYFAGGEPLITDEHYTMLEEMIRKGRTDIVLRYNTNASNIKYKNHDLLSLWKHFKQVELSCSVDHYGERAEWLRHGTDWGKIESNLLTFRELDFISFQMNTVFSMFNYPTIGEFYTYLINKNLLKPTDWHNTLYLSVNPTYYCSKALPTELKTLASTNAEKFCSTTGALYTSISRQIRNGILFANESDDWAKEKDTFFMHTLSIDKIRGENLFKVFPELDRLNVL